MKMVVETRQVKHIREMRSPSTKTRNIGLVYLQKGPDPERCMVRVITEATDVNWLEREIRKQTIYLPVDPVRVDS